MQEKAQQEQRLPEYDGIILLPFSLTEEGRLFLLQKNDIQGYRLIKAKMELVDECNPLAAALRLLRSEEFQFLLSLYDEAEDNPALQKAQAGFPPIAKKIAKWILSTASNYPRLKHGNSLVLPLLINQPSPLITQENSKYKLQSIIQWETQGVGQQLTSLFRIFETRLEDENSQELPYFALVNNQVEPIMYWVVALYFVGSVINESDKWRVFSSCAKEVPSEEDLASNKVRGVLMTGSPTSCYQSFEWTLFLKQWAAKLTSNKQCKIVGTCYGHQMLGLAMGGKVIRKKFIRKAEKMLFYENFWDLSFVKESVSAKLKSERSLYLQELHGDQVVEVPEGLDVYASSQSCGVECMGDGIHILSFQGHPEMTTDQTSEYHRSDKVKNQLGKKWEYFVEQHDPQKNPCQGLEIRRIQYAFLHSS